MTWKTRYMAASPSGQGTMEIVENEAGQLRIHAEGVFTHDEMRNLFTAARIPFKEVPQEDGTTIPLPLRAIQ